MADEIDAEMGSENNGRKTEPELFLYGFESEPSSPCRSDWMVSVLIVDGRSIIDISGENGTGKKRYLNLSTAPVMC